MPLRSDLFRGDTRLEGAAVRDSEHIVLGGSGPHVEKIQLALMLLDGAQIAASELSSDFYGASTADAVLAYKRHRRIVNAGYQTTPDNIVGRMTMASLDDEMVGREVRRKRCGCTYTPLNRPLFKQHFFALGHGAGSVGGAKQSTGGVQRSTLDMAFAAVPAAKAMRLRAHQALEDVISGRTTAALYAVGMAALTRHYKVTAAVDVDRVARAVRDNLAQVSSRLLSARAWLRQGTGSGFADTPMPRDGHSYINLDYGTAGQLLRPTILIHEAFHDIAEGHQDFGGNPAVDRGARYHQNDTATQLQNAYAMSQFVVHIHVGSERFVGDRE